MKKLNICFAILTAFFCLLTLSVMPEVYSQTYVEYITYDFILLVEIIFSALFILLAFTRINYKYLILIEPILVFVTILLINTDYSYSGDYSYQASTAKFITFSQYINKGLPIYFYLILIATVVFAALGYKYKNNVYTYINVGINSYFIIKLFYCFIKCANLGSKVPCLAHSYIMVTFGLMFVTTIVYSLRSLNVNSAEVKEIETVENIEQE
jgi:hypothetical protein